MQNNQCPLEVINAVGCQPEFRSAEQIYCISEFLKETFQQLNVKQDDCITSAKACVQLSFHKNEFIIKLKQQVDYFYIILEGEVSLNYLLTHSEQNIDSYRSVNNENYNSNNFRSSSQENQNKGQLQGLNNPKIYPQHNTDTIDLTKNTTKTIRSPQNQLINYRRLGATDYFGQTSICLKQLSQNIIQSVSKNTTCLAIPKETFNNTFKFYFNYLIQIDIDFLENNVHFFKDWNKNLLKRVVFFGQKIQTKRGNIIYNEGDNGDSVYLIVEGEFSAFRHYVYAPSFLFKNELNDFEKIRSDTYKDIDNKRQQKNLKILVLGVGELFGENELFLQEGAFSQRCFSVITESQNGVLIKINYEIFKELILSDVNTKQKIINFHNQRMKFVDEKIQKQRQQLNQYIDYIFESKSNLEMKKKSTDFIKNSLKSIDQLNRDSFNKFLQNAYQNKSPVKAKFGSQSNLQSPVTSQTQLSVPTLNYLIEDKHNDIVTEKDFKSIKSNLKTEESKEPKGSKPQIDVKANLQFMFQQARSTKVKNTKYQDLHYNNPESYKRYHNTFFYRYLENKQNTIEDPLMHRNKSKRQIGLENIQKNKSKASQSPERAIFSRQNSLMIQRMSEINEIHCKQQNLNSPHSTIVKHDNQIPSLSHIPRNLSPHSRNDQNNIVSNGSSIRFDDINNLSNPYRKHRSDIIPLNPEHKASVSPSKLSPQIKNRILISQSTHQLFEQNDSTKCGITKTSDTLEGNRSKQLLNLFKFIDPITHNTQNQDSFILNNISKINPISPQTQLPSRLNSCLGHFRTKSHTNISSSYLNDQAQIQSENQGNFRENYAITINHLEDKVIEDPQSISQVKQLVLPIEHVNKDFTSEETPQIYNSTGISTTNNKTCFRNAVYKNFNELFHNDENEGKNQQNLKKECNKKILTEQHTSFYTTKNIIKNNSEIIMKQGIKISYFKTNALSQKNSPKPRQISAPKVEQQIQNPYQLNKIITSSTTVSTPTSKNIHKINSKTKSSFDVFEKILQSKQNKSPQKINEQLIHFGMAKQINQNQTLFQNYAIAQGVNEKH